MIIYTYILYIYNRPFSWFNWRRIFVGKQGGAITASDYGLGCGEEAGYRDEVVISARSNGGSQHALSRKIWS